MALAVAERGAGETPFPLAHGSAGSREAKVFPPPCAPASGRRVLVTEKLILKIVCRPFLGRHVLCGVSVSTIFVKLLVRFWLVGGLAEGQKTIR